MKKITAALTLLLFSLCASGNSLGILEASETSGFVETASVQFGTENIRIVPGPVFNQYIFFTTFNTDHISYTRPTGGLRKLGENFDGSGIETVYNYPMDTENPEGSETWPLNVSFNENMFVAVFSTGNPLRIYKSKTGSHDFSISLPSENCDINIMLGDYSLTGATVRGGIIYAGLRVYDHYGEGRAQVISSQTGDEWTLFADAYTDFDYDDTAAYLSTAFGDLYCGTSNDQGGNLYRYCFTESEWDSEVGNGLGAGGSQEIIPAPKDFNGYLYVVTDSDYDIPRVWRNLNPDIPEESNWELSLDLSVEGPYSGLETVEPPTTTPSVETISVPGDGYLYISFSDSYNGAQIWRTKGELDEENREIWEHIVTDGFGDPSNSSAFLAPETFEGYLYAGTLNQEEEGRLYRLYTGEETEPDPSPDPDPDPSPDPDPDPEPVTEIDAGSMSIIGSSDPRRRGTINPDEGDTVRVIYRGSREGSFTLTIYTLLGEEVYRESRHSAAEGEFNWAPGNLASGTYIAHLKGPGVDKVRKIAILR